MKTVTLRKINFEVPEFQVESVLKFLHEKELESRVDNPSDILIPNLITLHSVGSILLIHSEPRKSGHDVDRMWDTDMRSWRPVKVSIEYMHHSNL